MSHAIVGVQRSVLDPALGNHDLETTGNLWVQPAHGEEITARIVLYTLDLGRLLEMFADARAGRSDEDLVFALDAAALDEPSEE